MYGKGLSRKRHNPDRNAEVLGVVCFWKVPDPDKNTTDKVKELPKCLYSYYVPNPIHYSINGNKNKKYLLEGEGQGHKEFYFFNQDSQDVVDHTNNDV